MAAHTTLTTVPTVAHTGAMGAPMGDMGALMVAMGVHMEVTQLPTPANVHILLREQRFCIVVSVELDPAFAALLAGILL